MNNDINKIAIYFHELIKNEGGNPNCNSVTWLSYDGECCSTSNPCGVGEGDCDINGECIGDLECGYRNCGSEFDTGADCCYVLGIVF